MSEEPYRPEDSVPEVLRDAAAWSWRLIVVGIVLYVVVRGVALFQVLVVPLLIALLVVALVKPVNDWLVRRGLPRVAAGLATVLLTLAIIGGLVTLIGQQVTQGFPELRDDAATGITKLQDSLANGPLNISAAQFDEYVKSVTDAVQGNSGQVVSGVLSITSTAGHVATGFFLVLFASYFFLAGGGQIWAWVVGLFPSSARVRVQGAGVRAWATLTAFIRATTIVAAVDAIGIGVVAAILSVPLALPLGVLVFIGAFVPIVGALVSGVVAVLVAFVAQGPVVALIMLGGVVAVQQLEAHVLQPFLLGRAVRVHPLAVIFGIAAGVLLAGVVGALFAVPLIAITNVVVSYLSGPADGGDSDDVPVAADDDSPPAEDREVGAEKVAEETGPLADT